jgi:nucleoid-associated protein YejK
MKALLILIVTVGTSQTHHLDSVDSSLDVRQIEFASIQSCERAAARLNNGGWSTSDWAKTYARTSPGRSGQSVFVSPPTMIAECVEVE